MLYQKSSVKHLSMLVTRGRLHGDKKLQNPATLRAQDFPIA